MLICARQFQNEITESVYTLLKIQIERFGLRGDFTITENSIRHNVTGAEFMFYGLWRHIDEIRSLEGIDICWIEEAHIRLSLPRRVRPAAPAPYFARWIGHPGPPDATDRDSQI